MTIVLKFKDEERGISLVNYECKYGKVKAMKVIEGWYICLWLPQLPTNIILLNNISTVSLHRFYNLWMYFIPTQKYSNQYIKMPLVNR